MKIAFLSYQADACDIAFRLGLEDNDVITYIENEEDNDCFDGIIPKAKTWQQAVKGRDILVFDDTKLSYIWKQCHKQIPCFGGSEFASRLEKDRAFAHSLMATAGIERMESKTYKTFREVIAHLKEHQKAHVVKPEGKDVKSHHLIVGEEDDNSDAISQVERLIDQGLHVDAIEVEERKHGTEVGISIFFNGLEQVGPACINFEHKHSHDKETGFLTGEMGTLVRYIEDPDLPLFKDTLAKMIPVLRASNYKGVIDLNMIVGEDDDGHFIAPLEFTPRLGKPMSFIMDELHVSPWSELMLACATSEKTDLRVRYDWGVGVNLCSFGFPFREMEHISRGLEIKGLDEDSLQHIHPIEVKMDRKGRFIHCPGVGEVLCATGRGETIYVAKETAYSNLSRVKMPNSFHRFDISEKIDPYRLDSLKILPVEEGSVK